MSGYVFDPSRLARSPKQLERDGYEVAGGMLREYLGSTDIFAEVHELVRRDPQLQAMLAISGELLVAPVDDPRLVVRRRARPRLTSPGGSVKKKKPCRA